MGANGTGLALLAFTGRANGPDFCAPCFGCGAIGAMEILVAFSGLDGALLLDLTGALLAAAFEVVLLTAGFTAALLAAGLLETFTVAGCATTLVGVLAGVLAIAVLAAGLLAAGLVEAAEAAAGFADVAAGAAGLADCAEFGAAGFCELEDENVSLIFWINEVCADAGPTSMMAMSS